MLQGPPPSQLSTHLLNWRHLPHLSGFQVFHLGKETSRGCGRSLGCIGALGQFHSSLPAPLNLTSNMALLGIAPSSSCTPSSLALVLNSGVFQEWGDIWGCGGRFTSIPGSVFHRAYHEAGTGSSVWPNLILCHSGASHWASKAACLEYIPVQGPSPIGNPPPPAPVPMAFSSFLHSILSPSVFSNTCLRVASGDGGSLQKTHLILTRNLTVSYRKDWELRNKWNDTGWGGGLEISKIQNEENSIRQILNK